MAHITVGNEKIIVLDFGSQYTHLIARRLREINVYSEIKCYDISLEQFKQFNPKGVILSGGPSSVNEAESPHVNDEVWVHILQSKIPILGICYGMQEIVHKRGGVVVSDNNREFGSALLHVNKNERQESNQLFGSTFTNIQSVWMSHGDSVAQLPIGFEIVAKTMSCAYAAIADSELDVYGVQFHPEVTHTVNGIALLSNFAVIICKVLPIWSMSKFATVEINKVRETVKDNWVIGALSGGVDSTVAAALLHKSVGSKFVGLLIDNGLMREGEAKEVIQRLKEEIPSLDIRLIDASERFVEALKGVTDAEKKRKIIGNAFIKEFEMAVSQMGLPLDGSTFLLQGTLYPDVIESVSSKGPSHTIKTHHNVGGLPEKMNLRIIEPFRELFKDEVRALGKTFGISDASIWRHPFPGPGLAIRIIGEVTKDRLDILRQADLRFIQILKEEGEYQNISQALVVLLPSVQSVGVMGDARTYEMAAVLRAVKTQDFMTAEWYKLPYNVLEKSANKIINEVKGINRVCYDVSSKPPATVEWE